MQRSVLAMEKEAHLALGAIWSFPVTSKTLKLFGALTALRTMALCTSRKLVLIKNMGKFYLHGQLLTLTRYAFIFVKCILVLGESGFKVAPGFASAIPAAV